MHGERRQMHGCMVNAGKCVGTHHESLETSSLGRLLLETEEVRDNLCSTFMEVVEGCNLLKKKRIQEREKECVFWKRLQAVSDENEVILI